MTVLNSMDNEDDNAFLWNCASREKAQSATQYHDSDIISENSLRIVKAYKHNGISEHLSNITVDIIESQGNGVFDSIGSEIWEAAILLCAHILLNPSQFTNRNILELGSGVGLPGLLLVYMQKTLHCQLTMSDNDAFVIANLDNTLTHQFDLRVMEKVSEAVFDVRLCELDWTLFSANADSVDSVPKSHAQDASGWLGCDLLMGSALCYSSDHVCLADLIQHHLSGLCEEVLVYQIGDREGFALLLDRLAALQVDFSVEPVPEEVYRCAQRVRRRRRGAYSSPAESDAGARSGPDDSVGVVTSYCFDGCRPGAHERLMAESEHHLGGGWSEGLLTTPREAFVLLTARRKPAAAAAAVCTEVEW